MPVIMWRNEGQTRTSLALGLLFLLVGPYCHGILAYGRQLRGPRISSEKAVQSTEQQHEGGKLLKYDTGESMHSMLQEYESVPNRQIWRPHIISEHTPFFLMHQRKAGGSSLRYTINKAVNNTGFTVFMPCFNNVGCEVFNIPVDTLFNVYGVHCTWNDLLRHLCVVSNDKTVENMARELVTATTLRSASSHSTNTTHDIPLNCSENSNLPVLPLRVNNHTTAPFSCLTNFREPVARVISCIYYRFDTYLLNRNLSCINDLSVARMTRLLVERLDKYNNSCLNEPYRVLGPFDDETVVTSLGYNYNNNTYEVSARKGELELITLSATLHNLQRCVPVVLELPHSYRLLKGAFPALHRINAFDHRVKENTAHNYSLNCAAPTPAHLKVIRTLTSFEDVLYQAVVKKVHSALREFKLNGLTKYTNYKGSNNMHHANHSTVDNANIIPSNNADIFINSNNSTVDNKPVNKARFSVTKLSSRTAGRVNSL